MMTPPDAIPFDFALYAAIALTVLYFAIPSITRFIRGHK